MNEIIPDSERPTREGMMPAVVAVVSTTLICLIVATLAFALAYGWQGGLAGP